jgi:hypothetical protein
MNGHPALMQVRGDQFRSRAKNAARAAQQKVIDPNVHITAEIKPSRQRTPYAAIGSEASQKKARNDTRKPATAKNFPDMVVLAIIVDLRDGNSKSSRFARYGNGWQVLG